MKSTKDLRSFKIYLPDENSKQFYIFCDLATILGDEFQTESLTKVKSKVKEQVIKPKLSFDHEADNVSIRTIDYISIIQVAKIIDSLALSDYKTNLSEDDWCKLEEDLKKWKRPKPQEWNENDIFSIKLKDGTFVFGQVLTKEKYKKTFALFDFKSEKEFIDFNELKKSHPITVLHLMGLKLNDRSWKIVGSLNERLADPIKGPWGDNYGHTGSDGFLESLANYYFFGEVEWKNEDDLKKLILKKKGLFDRFKKLF